ncbi:MAG: LuxR family transcriptional regulator [Rhodobacteraceae bacterium]|jgi:LuxR family transcriptional regulator, quorum-sensing system regulator SdiA|nr:LuxR family transcriptional regulator [Paracoccaceae bacterium]
MSRLNDYAESIFRMAPAGFYLALRVGFTFPEDELNRLPDQWVDYYTRHGLVVHDPLMKWVYGQQGAARWSDIDMPDPHSVRLAAKAHGLDYGAVASATTANERGKRSYGLFFRSDRDFDESDLINLRILLDTLHSGSKLERNLTANEIEALQMLASGLRLQQIADRLGISESAVKARLNNAKVKLGARTTSQAASLAAGRRLF